MKKQSTIALLLMASTAFAQNKSGVANFLDKQFKGYRAITASKAAQKTTATYWRISATASYADDGFGLYVFDSSSYKYSNARGSSVDLNGSFEVEDFGFESAILSDTTTTYSDQGGGLELYERNINSYDTKGLRSTIVNQTPDMSGGLENDLKQVAVRDANDLIIKRYTLSWTGSQWDTIRISNLTYNANGKVMLDSTYNIVSGSFVPSYKREYGYDGNGNLAERFNLSWDATNSNWDTSAQELTMHISNQISVVISKYYNNGTIIFNYRDSIVNDNNGNYIYSLGQNWDDVNMNWVNSDLETRTIANNQPTRSEFFEWDASSTIWEKVYEADFNYNGNGDIDNIPVYEYINGTRQSNPEMILKLYYEHYFNVGIDNTTTNTKLKLYPNPATHVVSLALGKTISELKIEVMDIQGKVQGKYEFKESEKVQLNIAHLPAGTYLLQIHADNNPPVDMKFVKY